MHEDERGGAQQNFYISVMGKRMNYASWKEHVSLVLEFILKIAQRIQSTVIAPSVQQKKKGWTASGGPAGSGRPALQIHRRTSIQLVNTELSTIENRQESIVTQNILLHKSKQSDASELGATVGATASGQQQQQQQPPAQPQQGAGGSSLASPDQSLASQSSGQLRVKSARGGKVREPEQEQDKILLHNLKMRNDMKEFVCMVLREQQFSLNISIVTTLLNLLLSKQEEMNKQT